jgi:hypothetical protein
MTNRSQREARWVFREQVYESLGRRRDALFDLLDALLVAGAVPSFIHLSLTALFRRGWGSAYDALAAGVVDAGWLREIVAGYPFEDGAPLYALDTSVWPRCDAACSPQRGFYHSSSRQSAGKPIVAGWSYAWLAQLSFTHDSWTAPLDVRRVPVEGDAHRIAAAQIRALVRRQPANGAAPLCLFDAGYDPGTLAQALGELDGTQVAVLVRVRGDRCFYAEPEPRASRIGRPRRHGPKFACKDERTWWAPSAEHAEAHQQYGRVRVRAWAGVHAKVQHRPTRGHRRRTWPILHGTLPRQTRIPRRLWLWWRGPGEPDLAVVWRAYVRRFDLEHTCRFGKQTLNWTTPRVRHPGPADRWTWLVLLAYTQLRLARRIAADQRLPWEAPQHPRRAALTPARVRQGFPALLGWLGTPATAPKPCGRSPGRPTGARSGPAPRYPAVKKTA